MQNIKKRTNIRPAGYPDQPYLCRGKNGRMKRNNLNNLSIQKDKNTIFNATTNQQKYFFVNYRQSHLFCFMFDGVINIIRVTEPKKSLNLQLSSSKT